MDEAHGLSIGDVDGGQKFKSHVAMLSVGTLAYRGGMNVICVPGFWLGAWSWHHIIPALEAAGHDVTAVTLPGLESVDADRSGIGLAQHVAAVVSLVDAADGPVVLVGHSGGGTVIHAVVDQRPDQVASAIYVDSGPLPHGSVTNAELPATGPDLPLPPWEVFGGEGSRDLHGFSEAQLTEFRARAVPHPAAAASGPQVLSDDDRRYGVPITIISTTFTLAEIQTYTEAGEPYFAELPKIADVSIIELPTSHWPQFTEPQALAAALLAAI